MQSATDLSRQFQVLVRTFAILSGGALIVSAAWPDSGPLNIELLIKFISNQIQTIPQIKWLLGTSLLVAGVFFTPTLKKKKVEFIGSKVLENNTYLLYLIGKYDIQRNIVLDQISFQGELFTNLDEVLNRAHLIECPQQVGLEANTLNLEDVEKVITSKSNVTMPVETQVFDAQPRISERRVNNSSLDAVREAAKLRKILILGGTLFFTVLLSLALYYASLYAKNYKSFSSNAPQVSLVMRSDQVVSGLILAETASGSRSLDPQSIQDIQPSKEIQPTQDLQPTQEVVQSTKSQEITTQAVTPAINASWIGSWVASSDEGQKLVISSSKFIVGEQEFNWTGFRPKGALRCCSAFYEGGVSKADLLMRLPVVQDPSTPLKLADQKESTLIKGLSEGSFKKIILVDPVPKNYYFLHDQNFIYRISRDPDAQSSLLIEQFRRD